MQRTAVKLGMHGKGQKQTTKGPHPSCPTQMDLMLGFSSPKSARGQAGVGAAAS